MHRFKRPKIRVVLPEPDADVPPKPKPIDIEIARNKGTTIAIEATNERLQASKSDPTPSLSEMIEQQLRENGRLREQLAYLLRKQEPSTYLLETVTFIMKQLEQAVIEYHRLETVIEQDRVGS